MDSSRISSRNLFRKLASLPANFSTSFPATFPVDFISLWSVPLDSYGTLLRNLSKNLSRQLLRNFSRTVAKLLGKSSE